MKKLNFNKFFNLFFLFIFYRDCFGIVLVDKARIKLPDGHVDLIGIPTATSKIKILPQIQGGLPSVWYYLALGDRPGQTVVQLLRIKSNPGLANYVVDPTFNATKMAPINDITFDDQGRVYTGGVSSNPATVNPTKAGSDISENTETMGLITAFDSTGKMLWQKSLHDYATVTSTRLNDTEDALFAAGISPDQNGYVVGKIKPATGEFFEEWGNNGQIVVPVDDFASNLGVALGTKSLGGPGPLADQIYVAYAKTDPETNKVNTLTVDGYLAITGALAGTFTVRLPGDIDIQNFSIAELSDGDFGSNLTAGGAYTDTDGNTVTFSAAIQPNLTGLVSYYGQDGISLISLNEPLGKGVNCAKHIVELVAMPTLNNKREINFIQRAGNGKPDFNVSLKDGTKTIAENIADLTSIKTIETVPGNSRWLTTATAIPDPRAENSSIKKLDPNPVPSPVLAIVTRVIPDNELSPIVAQILRKYCGAI